jgi:hypothetical protein
MPCKADAKSTDHLFVPGNGELDKMLRYEAMIIKHLNHTMAELESAGKGSRFPRRSRRTSRFSFFCETKPTTILFQQMI